MLATYYYVCDVTLSVYPHRASLKKYARIEPTTFGILAQCSGSGQFEYVYGRHFFKLFYIKAFLYQPKVIVLMRGMDHSPINQNFDLNKSRQTYHSMKEHHKISNIPKFRCEML